MTPNERRIPPSAAGLATCQNPAPEVDSGTAPIAIVGASCRFPGAPDLAGFWTLLREGGDAVGPMPEDRWDERTLASAALGHLATRQGGFLDEVSTFDADFFSMSRREARQVDPQQRHLLETTWAALEDAGRAGADLSRSRTGVFVGISNWDYSRRFSALPDPPDAADAQFATGNALSIAANRISYLLDLGGPSISVDTACSSSLVAVHLACQSLRLGECDMAIVGGVNLILSGDISIVLSKAGMLSPDGRCKPFDASADGFGRGEGCGVVVLRRLCDARAEGDHVRAVVRGTAINQDGHTNGLTAPNGFSQEAVIREALAKSRLPASEVDCVEAHGTGTPLGDPIEYHALARVYGDAHAPPDCCYLGSVKGNIGHLESAAGIAGVLKLMLSLEQEEIPRVVHLRALNPRISRCDSLILPRETVAWPSGRRRVGAVSSFGFGGTNAHAILEAAPVPEPRPMSADDGPQVLVLSSRTKDGLREMAGRLSGAVAEHAGPLGDLCFTAAVGRTHLGHRLAIPAANGDSLRTDLEAFAESGHGSGIHRGERVRGRASEVVFLFTGQGAQYAGMGRELYETQPIFRETLERCAETLDPLLPRPLLSVLYGDARSAPLLDETQFTQPALYAVCCALTDLYRSWGIEAGAVLGHSVGEYAAAYASGIFDLETGSRLVAERARLLQSLPTHGAMAAILAGEERVAAAVSSRARVDIAAVNGPANTVVSGDAQAVQEVVDELSNEGIEARPLRVSHAFHSPLVEPILSDFEAFARRFEFASPRSPFVSNETGRGFEDGTGPGASYWARHIRAPVRFAEGLETLSSCGFRVFLELGPHPTLTRMGRECIDSADVSWLSSLRRGAGDCERLVETVARLYVCGVEIDWRRFHLGKDGRRIPLPGTVFRGERFWLSEGRASQPEEIPRSSHDGPRYAVEPTAEGELMGRQLDSLLELFQNQLAALGQRSHV